LWGHFEAGEREGRERRAENGKADKGVKGRKKHPLAPRKIILVMTLSL